jgi:hypothetical protein
VQVPVPRQLRPENDGKGHSGRQGLETIVMMDIWRIPAAQPSLPLWLPTYPYLSYFFYFLSVLLL